MPLCPLNRVHSEFDETKRRKRRKREEAGVGWRMRKAALHVCRYNLEVWAVIRNWT